MKNGMVRFEFYLAKLEQLISQAAKEINPALWLYTNGARNTVFMLEGLSKLYAGMHNKKRFEKIKDHLKLLEDTLGAIDYYDTYAKEFTGASHIPVPVTAYMQAQAREKIQRLNDILVENNWVGDRADRIKKIRNKISDADWMEPKEEVKAILGFYKASIKEINDFMAAAVNGFTEMEAQVHSMRRKLRWLSIYPQALQGVVQLTDSAIPDEAVNKYLIPEILNSPFNKMPDAGNNTFFLLLEKNYFMALSWIIAELGVLKDDGLRILAVTEAIQQIEKTDHNHALDMANQLLTGDHEALKNLLKKANDTCKLFFAEKNIDKLIHGIAAVKK